MASTSVDTTGTVIAYGEQGSASSPNIVSVETSADTLLGIGGAADATLLLSSGDGIITFELVGGDELYAKAVAGTATVTSDETAPKRGLNLSDVTSLASSWYSLVNRSSDDQQLKNRGPNPSSATTGSTSSADSNDPVMLDHDGTHYVYMPGASTDDLLVADEAALDITGDLDVRVRLSRDTTSNPAADGLLISKLLNSGNFSYRFRHLTSGSIQLGWSADGTAVTAANSTATPTWTVNDPLWIRATLDVDNGASGYDVKFYTSTDGVAWTQLGATVTGGATTSIFAGTDPVRLGGLVTGCLFRAQVYDGIDGTNVLDINPAIDIDTSADPDAGQASFTATTGQTVTVNRGTSGLVTAVVTRPVAVFDGVDDYLQLPTEDTPTFTKTTGKHTVVVAWRRWLASATWERLVSFEPSANDGILLGFNNTDKVAAYVGDGTAVGVAQAAGYTAGDIYVSAAVVDDGTLYIYQNGEALASVSLGTVSTDPEFTVGRVGASGYAVASLPDGLEVFDVLSFHGTALNLAQLDALTAGLRSGGFRS